MEENFYKDEFERFLQEQANNHRMYPSDSVWRNISKRLHGDKTWPALTIAAFTFLAAVIAISVYFSPGPNIFAIKVPPVKVEKNSQPSTPLLSSVSNSDSRHISAWKEELTSPSTRSVNSLKETTTAPSAANLIAAETKLPIGIQSGELATVSNTPRISSSSASRVEKRFTAANKNIKRLEKSESAMLETVNPDLSMLTPLNELLFEKGKERAAINETLIPKRTTRAAAKYVNPRKKNKFSYSVYIAPSKSYRKLTEDPAYQEKQVSPAAGPVALNYASDVNQIVRHIPGNGVEAGVAFGYNLSKNIKITSGFQFNIRQYYIEAFKANLEMTTIALQTGERIDSINRLSGYRTISGYTSTELVNRYYQISFPVGVELKVLGSKDIELNVAGSIQPTYTINNNAYLISTNFKNYAESGAMLRNWNINTSVEAFLSIKSGFYRWQLGPQFRYQQLPSFTSQYPIKEHLMDYGLKIGVSKTIR